MTRQKKTCGKIGVVLRVALIALFTLFSLAALHPKAEAVITCKHLNCTWRTTKEPTCCQTGIKQKICNKCGAVVQTQTLPKTNRHIAKSSYETTCPATCTTDGTKVLRCKYCNTIMHTCVIPKFGHDCYVQRQNATCTTDGWERTICTRCGCTVASAVRPALGHNPSDWITTTEATCSEYGVQSQTCTRCNAVVNTRTLPMKKHVLAPATCTTPETCINCNATFGSPAPHKFLQPTCTYPGTCLYCGCSSGEAPLSHSYNAWGMCTVCRQMSPAPYYSVMSRKNYLLEALDILESNPGTIKVKTNNGVFVEFTSDNLLPGELGILNCGLQSELFTNQNTDYCPHLIRGEGDLYYYITPINDPDWLGFNNYHAMNITVVRCESSQASEDINMTIKIENGWTFAISDESDSDGFNDFLFLENSCVPFSAEVAAVSNNNDNRIMGLTTTSRQHSVNVDASLEFLDNSIDTVGHIVEHEYLAAGYSAFKAVKAACNISETYDATETVDFHTHIRDDRYSAGTMFMAVSTAENASLTQPGDYITYTITCQNDENNCADIDTYFYVYRAN